MLPRVVLNCSRVGPIFLLIKCFRFLLGRVAQGGPRPNICFDLKPPKYQGKTTSSLLDNTASIGSHAATDICDVAVIVALVVIRALAAAPAPAYALASAPIPAPRTALAPAHASASGPSPAPVAATPLAVACSRCPRARVSLPWLADWRSGERSADGRVQG